MLVSLLLDTRALIYIYIFKRNHLRLSTARLSIVAALVAVATRARKKEESFIAEGFGVFLDKEIRICEEIGNRDS